MKTPIPDSTRDAMWQFFYQTSIPRLVAKEKKRRQEATKS